VKTCSILFAIVLFLLIPCKIHADSPIIEPDYGNLFLCGQHALAAEMRYQPPASLLEGARVLRGKGMCYRDTNWLTSWGVALRQRDEHPESCIEYYACQGYFLFATIEPRVREPIAVAVYAALVENPSIERFHFDAADAPLAWWWFSPIACPTGFFVVGTMRYC
jgi:hypothetical protein